MFWSLTIFLGLAVCQWYLGLTFRIFDKLTMYHCMVLLRYSSTPIVAWVCENGIFHCLKMYYVVLWSWYKRCSRSFKTQRTPIFYLDQLTWRNCAICGRQTLCSSKCRRPFAQCWISRYWSQWNYSNWKTIKIRINHHCWKVKWHVYTFVSIQNL